MKKSILASCLLFCSAMYVLAQDAPKPPPTKLGIGIGIYPTGTETGFGVRTAKDKRIIGDFRVTKANMYTKPESGSLVNEASILYRLVYYEKVRFHAGIGARADWNLDSKQPNRFGIVTPIGVEAFPFPFQNAGLFFETAPFVTVSPFGQYNFGLRTVAGFVFYFSVKEKEQVKF